MASTTQIVLRFGTPSGEKNFIYNYGNDDATAEQIRNAMNAMIQNGSIYKYPPQTIIGAKSVIKTESEWEL